MGMFDSVYAYCPECGTKMEFQSKAGDCNLADYDADRVPVAIAEDISGQYKACECGHVSQINISADRAYVKMELS